MLEIGYDAGWVVCGTSANREDASDELSIWGETQISECAQDGNVADWILVRKRRKIESHRALTFSIASSKCGMEELSHASISGRCGHAFGGQNRQIRYHRDCRFPLSWNPCLTEDLERQFLENDCRTQYEFRVQFVDILRYIPAFQREVWCGCRPPGEIRGVP